jgi:hypothetical protein
LVPTQKKNKETNQQPKYCSEYNQNVNR